MTENKVALLALLLTVGGLPHRPSSAAAHIGHSPGTAEALTADHSTKNGFWEEPNADHPDEQTSGLEQSSVRVQHPSVAAAATDGFWEDSDADRSDDQTSRREQATASGSGGGEAICNTTDIYHYLDPADHQDHGPSAGHAGGTVMYFFGFRSTFASNSAAPCLNMYFSTWTLDRVGKVIAALLGAFLLAAFTEGASYVRLRIRRDAGAGILKKTTIVAMHTLQAVMGYVLMLAVMTFSVEMLLAVIFGLAVGYAVFFDEMGEYNPTNSLAGAVHVTTSPCCVFMADEALELKRPFEPCQCPCAQERSRAAGSGALASESKKKRKRRRRSR